MSSNHLPQPDEIEFSLFGPGIGECIVVHLGAGDWMVVDSCMNAERNTSIALEYLEGIGVKIQQQVKLVVVTHWHDDHIRGIAKLMQQADCASFVCSAALNCREFFTLFAADRNIQCVEHTSGTSEFSDILDIFEARNTGNTTPVLQWAHDSCRLYHNQGVEVWALSPSNQTVTDAMKSIATEIPNAGNPKRRFSAQNPNELAVVLLVKTPAANLLLGADLEIGKDGHRGWQAVVTSNLRPQESAQTYKVAHHGSENADMEGIWNSLLTEKPIACLTPYVRGPKPLPDPKDILRLKDQTSQLYATFWPIKKSPAKRNPAVERTIREITKNHNATRKQPGHIRVRIPNVDKREPAITLFNGARKVG